MMSGTKSFLLVDNEQNHQWHAVLRDTLMPLGTLRVANEAEAVSLVMSAHFDLIIVDAAVRSVPLLVARIRTQHPAGSIVVVAADPSWHKAREAFQAGASDYIAKTLDRSETFSSIYVALRKAGLGKKHGGGK